jgi:hypothetical protein
MAWTDSQGKAFMEMVLAMGEVFNEPVSTVRVEMFTRLVEDLPFEKVTAAMVQLGRRATFFPKPGEIRELVEGNVTDEAEQGWMAMLSEIRRVGYTGTPEWPNEATKRTVEGMFGSWRALCERLPAAGPEFLGYHKQFVAAFGSNWRQAAAGQLGPGRTEARAVLEGITDQLAKRGLPSSEGPKVVPHKPRTRE